MTANLLYHGWQKVQSTLTLLIKASAMVTVYRGHHRTLLPARVNSLFIMCIGIIRNNSLLGGRARAESNPGHSARHSLLHMALSIRSWKQVSICVRRRRKFGEISCTECTGQGISLISMIEMKTRKPIEGYFGSEFPAICNHCVVMATKTRK